MSIAALGLACTAVAPMRSKAARGFHCSAHRVEIARAGLLGDEPVDRKAIRAELRDARRDEADGLDTVHFSVEGCGHRDQFICHRRGPGRAFRCGTMIR